MKIDIKNLSFHYPGSKKNVLDDITLTIPSGKFTAVIGPNGSGKTTLVKQINQILVPQKGTIYLDGEDVADMTPAALARKIAYVPQMGQGAIGGTVLDTVLLGRKPYVKYKLSQEDIEIAVSAMLRLHIDHLAEREFLQLSGGQKQTVLLARALAQTPRAFLFDEPISFLDIRNQLEIMHQSKKLSLHEGKTVVAVLHDLNMAYRYADYVIIMKGGNVYACGSPAEAITPENIWDVYGARAQIYENRFVVTEL